MSKATSTWVNNAGQEVPAQYVPERDKKATRLVQKHMKLASELSAKLVKLRSQVLQAVDEFVDWSAAANGVKVAGGEKGNVDLTTFDGKLQIRIRKPEYVEFDERLQQAKELIDQFLQARASTKLDQILIEMITTAFTTTRDGRVRADAVLAVHRRVKLDDPLWRRAMDLIEQSKLAVKARTYIRFYVREDTESDWILIPLDLANV